MTVEHLQEFTLLGHIPEADQAKMTFQLERIYGGRVTIPIHERHHDTVLEAFRGYRDGAKVLVRGKGRANGSDRLRELESVERVSLLDPLDVTAQLDDLRNLRDGWADGTQTAGDWGNGYGKAPNHEALDWLDAKFAEEYPDGLPRPYIYPTPEGGVQMEWSIGSYEAEIEVHLLDHTAEWFWADTESDDEGDCVLNMDDAKSWKWIVTELRRLSGDAN